MTLEEIQAAVESGQIVCWSNSGYVVQKNRRGEFDIVCPQNGHRIGLTHQDGVTLNGKPESFYIETEEARE